MAVVRWMFTDSVESTNYEFDINPNDGGSPTYRKNVTTQVTTAPGGTPIIFEGQEEPKSGSFSGTILDLAQYQAMVLWFTKRYPIEMTDDLGREQSIYITGFDAKRVRSAMHPYKHSYTCSYIVLELTDL